MGANRCDRCPGCGRTTTRPVDDTYCGGDVCLRRSPIVEERSSEPAYRDSEQHHTDWQAHAVCPNCKWHMIAPFGSLFHCHIECCPNCGNPKGIYQRGNLAGNISWTIETMQFRYYPGEDDKTWWKKLTEGRRGNWISKEREEARHQEWLDEREERERLDEEQKNKPPTVRRRIILDD